MNRSQPDAKRALGGGRAPIHTTSTTRTRVVADTSKQPLPFVSHSHLGPRGSVAAAALAGTELAAMCGFSRVPVLPLPACRVRCPICARLVSEMFPDGVTR